jgi:hypothetical protein
MKRRLIFVPGTAFASVLTVTLAFFVTNASAQEYIVLTKGGGVTGNTTVFRISPSGEVAKGSGTIDPAYSEFAKLRKSRAKRFFRKTRALMEKETFNYPGNMYTAIALVDGGKEGKIVWGDASHETPVKATKLYQKIQSSLNRLTFSKDLRK